MTKKKTAALKTGAPKNAPAAPVNPNSGPPTPGDVDVNYAGKLKKPKDFVKANKTAAADKSAELQSPAINVKKFTGAFDNGVYQTITGGLICISSNGRNDCCIKKGTVVDGELKWGNEFTILKSNLVKLLTIKKE